MTTPVRNPDTPAGARILDTASALFYERGIRAVGVDLIADVAGTTQLDAVHRVLGRPGVVLVAEGAPHRVKTLLAQEKKRIARVVGDTPIYDFIVGNEENQVPLRRLQQTIMKLPNNMKPAQIDVLEKRMSALAARGAQLPKGPMPQGAKMRNVQRTIRRR